MEQSPDQEQQTFQINTCTDQNAVQENKVEDECMRNDTLEYNYENSGDDEEPSENVQKEEPNFKLKTRRQTRGLVYFNRKKPQIQITIGSLEEFYNEQQLRKFKRRRLNMSADDILQEDSKDEIELNHNAIDSKMNKSFLYENWQEDFEKEKKREERRNKKRKREESRSKSRSPTPVSNKNLQLDFQTQTRRGSVKQSNESNPPSQQVTDSEEENRRELQKIKADIIQQLETKDEPMTLLQLSYNTKYAKKYCEEGIKELISENKIKQKEIAKNITVFGLVINDPKAREELLQTVKECLVQEAKELQQEQEIAELEKKIKSLKLQPTTEAIKNNITQIEEEIQKVQQENEAIKQRPDFLGINGLQQSKALNKKLEKTLQIFQKRKVACIDMLDYLSQHLNEDFGNILLQAGIDQDDFLDNEGVNQIFGLAQEDAPDNQQPAAQQQEQEETHIFEDDIY